uniref:Uncharacterized protein n=1 Tax=uncultured marine virus TaxID=186617 RepID=A0A0F7LAR8_9VIRU|nr:hypothetical protein [uncultured marine virus]
MFGNSALSDSLSLSLTLSLFRLRSCLTLIKLAAHLGPMPRCFDRRRLNFRPHTTHRVVHVSGHSSNCRSAIISPRKVR